MLILSISHHIYLSKEQRYALINGESVDVMGVSIPVWIKNNGMSTEPAVEVLCNYELTNKDEKTPIHFKQDGYVINLPQLSEQDKAPKTRLSNEIWRSFTVEERNDYYSNLPNPISAEWLRDIKDEGSEHLQFREHNKIFQDEESLEVYHYIHMDDIAKLEQSLC